jgi:Glycosyltransferase family 87
MSTIQQRRRSWWWLILSILSALGMWYYVFDIWSVNQPTNFSDLYAQWWAAHELFLHGRNPYTPAIAHEIQSVIYGAPLTTSSPGDPAGIAGGFAYPLHVVFLMWPTIRIPFSIVQRVFSWISLGLTLASILLWVSVLEWKLPIWKLVTISLFTVGSFPSFQGMKLQNLSLVAAFLISATLVSLIAGHLKLAGILLAMATIKPQFLILLMPWLVIWSLGDWQARQRFFWSFSAMTGAVILVTELIMPGWIGSFLDIVHAYKQYTYGHSLLDVWFGQKVGAVASLGLTLFVLTLCWRRRSCGSRSPGFMLVTGMALGSTLVVIPTLEPHAQLLLLPGFLLVLRYSRPIWQSGKLARLLLVATWSLLGWEWLAAAGMMFAGIWVCPGVLLRFWMLPLYSSPLLPFGIFILCAFLLLMKSGSDSADHWVLS